MWISIHILLTLSISGQLFANIYNGQAYYPLPVTLQNKYINKMKWVRGFFRKGEILL